MARLYLDDLLLVPLGLMLTLKMIPPEVMAECRARAQEAVKQGKPTNWVAAGFIIAVWFLLAGLGVVVIKNYMSY